MPFPPWRVAMATSIGTSHLASGIPCQDSAECMLLGEPSGDPVLTVAISDGAGSAEHSKIGSSIACRTVIGIADVFLTNGGRVEEISRQVVEGWLEQVSRTINDAAVENGHKIRDYACTLLCAILSIDAAAFIQIGDGAIVVSHGEEDGWCYVFWPQHGEFANATNFLISENALAAADFELARRRIDEVAVFTDGLENLVLHTASRSVHEPFFDRMFPPVRKSNAYGVDGPLSQELERYLSSAIICERTNDDKSL